MTREEIGMRLKTNKYWYNKSYAGYFFGIYQQARAIAWEAGRYQFAMPYGVLFQNYEKKPHMDWFWDNDLLKQKREEILAEAVRDPNFADTFYQTWKKDLDIYLDYYEWVADLDLGQKSDQELAAILKKLDGLYLTMAGRAYSVDTFLTNDGDWLVEEIKNELGEGATDEVVAHLTAPTHASFVNESGMAILKIAALLAQGEKERAAASAADYARRYFWVKSSYLDFRRLTAAEVLAEAGRRASEGQMAEHLAEEEHRTLNNKNKKAELFDLLNVSPRLRRIINIAELFTHVQDKRKERVLRTNTIFLSALELIGQRKGIDPTLLFNATEVEIFDLLEGGSAKLELWADRRDNGVLVICSKDGSELYERSRWPEVVTLENFFVKHEAVEFKGSIAYKGLVRGRARVMSTSAEIATFKEGEILVTNQTTPEFVPAMKKAAAIVTDQGGITCHAAIVSRELKKPCIIGTKIATKVLKDGDLIEVDADKGIVRILARGN